MSHTDVVISGFGGQGVILTGLVLGKAISIYSEGFATMTQNFGPEARGGACTAQVVIDTNPIRYPYVQKPDVLLAMSQEAYDKHIPNLNKNGVLLYEEELIELSDEYKHIRSYGIHAARIAEELGSSMFLNMVMIGFISGAIGLVEPESAKKAIAASVPASFVSKNHLAFDRGYEVGRMKVMNAEIITSEAGK